MVVVLAPGGGLRSLVDMHTVGQEETPGLAVDAKRWVPFVKLFWGDAEHVPDVFAGSGFIAIVPPVDAALDGFGVERVDWLLGSSVKISKDQRYGYRPSSG